MSDGQPRAEVVSKSLIRTSIRPGITKEGANKFCLGIPGWCPCCEEPMEKDSKRAPKSLQLTRPRQTKVSNENCKRSKESNSEHNEYECTTTAQLVDVSNIMVGAVSNPPSSSIGQVPAHQQVAGNSSMSSSATTAPTCILNGCTFTGCSIAFSGQVLHQSTSKEEQRICDETLQGIGYEEIFDD